MDLHKKKLGKKKTKEQNPQKASDRYARPSWVPQKDLKEEELCPDCFKVVGERSRYSLVCTLGKAKDGMTVSQLTEHMQLRQPTITHHLKVLQSVDAVEIRPRGRERVYTLNRDAHCFEECNIPY